MKPTKFLTTGRLIEAVMKYRGMRINELGPAVGEHPANLYKMFRGDRPITPALAIKFAKALNMPPLVIIHSAMMEFCEQQKNSTTKQTCNSESTGTTAMK